MSLTYFSILVLSYCGLFVGVLLRRIAKQEAKDYKSIIDKVGLGMLLIIILGLAYYKFYILALAGFVVLAVLYHLKKMEYVYPLLGLVLYAVFSVSQLFLIVGFLIFLYGFVIKMRRFTVWYLILGSLAYATQLL